MSKLFAFLAATALTTSMAMPVYAQEDQNASDDSQTTMAIAEGEMVSVADIEGFDEGRTLKIVPVDDAAPGPQEGGVGPMVDAESDNFEAILDAIENNPLIYDQLETEGYTRDDIAGVWMNADGELTIRVTRQP